MVWAHPKVVLPGTLVRVKRPRNPNAHTECHCSFATDALFSDATVLNTLPVTRCQLHELVQSLPTRFQDCMWDLVFDTELDGFSLAQFYRNVGDRHHAGICLLTVVPRDRSAVLIGDSTCSPPPASSGTPTPVLHSPASAVPEGTFASFGDSDNVSSTRHNYRVRGLDGQPIDHTHRSVIGCFASEIPNLRHNPHHFYGSRETFVFNLSHDNGGVRKYGWAGNENEEFLLSSLHFLGIGGGRDGAAIFLDEDLNYGTSSVHCQTFLSPPLFSRPKQGLHHSEFVITRMMWFALDHHSALIDVKRRMARLVQQDGSDGPTSDASVCGCGRGPHHHHCD